MVKKTSKEERRKLFWWLALHCGMNEQSQRRPPFAGRNSIDAFFGKKDKQPIYHAHSW
jgi:hypothetical protein